MAVLRSRLTQGVVEVDDAAAKALIDSGLWDAADAPAPRKKAARKAVEDESGE